MKPYCMQENEELDLKNIQLVEYGTSYVCKDIIDGLKILNSHIDYYTVVPESTWQFILTELYTGDDAGIPFCNLLLKDSVSLMPLCDCSSSHRTSGFVSYNVTDTIILNISICIESLGLKIEKGISRSKAWWYLYKGKLPNMKVSDTIALEHIMKHLHDSIPFSDSDVVLNSFSGALVNFCIRVSLSNWLRVVLKKTQEDWGIDVIEDNSFYFDDIEKFSVAFKAYITLHCLHKPIEMNNAVGQILSKSALHLERLDSCHFGYIVESQLPVFKMELKVYKSSLDTLTMGQFVYSCMRYFADSRILTVLRYDLEDDVISFKIQPTKAAFKSFEKLGYLSD